MLISDVINARSIALAATNDASNLIPYLGGQWFPAKKIAGLDLKWIKTHNGLPVTLKPSNFDAIPVLRARDGLKAEKTQMAFFRESMQIGEAEAQELDRIREDNDPYLDAALRAIYDDTTRLVRGAEVVPEIMIMSLLAGDSNGHPAITLSSDGVNYTYDYDPNGAFVATHFEELTGTAMWNHPSTATPITDLNNGRKALQQIGKTARYALMNSKTFAYLLTNEQVRGAILAQNLTANVYMTDEIVKQVIRNLTKLDIVIYDKMYTDYSGNQVNFYPDDRVTLLPAEALGSFFFGTTPEERTARQVADVDVTMYREGIAIAVKTEYGPPAKTSTTASMIGLPSFEGMDSIYIMNVHDASGETGETGETGDTGDTGETGETGTT